MPDIAALRGRNDDHAGSRAALADRGMIGPKYFAHLGRAEAAANGLAERLPNNFIDRERARKMTLIRIRHVSCNQCVVAFLGLGKKYAGPRPGRTQRSERTVCPGASRPTA
jgi:hypothetical protein